MYYCCCCCGSLDLVASCVFEKKADVAAYSSRAAAAVAVVAGLFLRRAAFPIPGTHLIIIVDACVPGGSFRRAYIRVGSCQEEYQGSSVGKRADR